jgi:hypothetical protein
MLLFFESITDSIIYSLIYFACSAVNIAKLIYPSPPLPVPVVTINFLLRRIPSVLGGAFYILYKQLLKNWPLLSFPSWWFEAVLKSESLDLEFELLWTIIASRGRFKIIYIISSTVTTFVPDKSNKSKIILSKLYYPPRQIFSEIITETVTTYVCKWWIFQMKSIIFHLAERGSVPYQRI